MPGKNKLSVCCLGFKHEAFASECVTSIWAGGHDNVEIIVLDDGSNDSTVRKLEETGKDSPFPIKILTQDNTGNIPANFNRLLENATGDYVLFSSLDDMPMPGSLGRMMAITRDGDRVFVAHTTALMLSGDGHTELEMFAPAANISSASELLEAEYEYLHSFYIQGAIFRRDILDQIGGFDSSLLGDDIVLRTRVFNWLTRNPVPFGIIDGPGCIYRRHSGNVSRNTVRQVQVAMEYCDKFWPERPYPDILKSWLLTALDEEPLHKVMPLFKYGKSGMQYLKDNEIRSYIHRAEESRC